MSAAWEPIAVTERSFADLVVCFAPFVRILPEDLTAAAEQGSLEVEPIAEVMMCMQALYNGDGPVRTKIKSETLVVLLHVDI